MSRGLALIIDCHSYPSFATRADQIEGAFRPQFVIGTDPYHTPPDLAQECAECFTRAGYSVGMNTPFAGTIVPLKHYGKDPRVQLIMIEVRRDLYMDETTGKKIAQFNAIRILIQLLLQNNF